MIITPEELAIHESDENLLELINNKVFKDIVLYEKNSNFHTIKIVENEIGRFLHYKDTYQAGIINTKHYKGNIPYINYFLIPYLINPKIKNILLIGMGTGIIVNQYEKLFSNLKRIDVVDIEENILEIAQQYFDFKISKKFNFILQDGLVYLNNSKQKYDLIIVDVASDEGIDDRFCEKDYLKVINSHLKKDGLFVSNMPSSADVLNEKNTFVLNLIKKYKKEFACVDLYKGNESDRIYYKAFFDIDKRVVDITNLIFISSNTSLKINLEKRKNEIKNIEKLGVSIYNYLKDLI